MARKKKKPTSRKGEKKKRSGGESGKRASKEVEAQAVEPEVEATEGEHPPEAPADDDPAPVALEEEGVAIDDPAVDDIAIIDLDAEASEDPVERLIAEMVAKALPEEAPEPAAERDAESLPRRDVAAEVARRLVDLGPVSSPEVRDRLLAQALAHAEHKDARYKIPFSAAAGVGRWKVLAGTLILLVAGAVAVAPPGWVRPEPPARLADAERARNLRAALLLQAQQVEAFRVRTQQLPRTLDEVAERLPGVRYVRSGSRGYQLIAYESNGNAVVYDSANPGTSFADLTTWVASGAVP